MDAEVKLGEVTPGDGNGRLASGTGGELSGLTPGR
jgi:hypothetical protein